MRQKVEALVKEETAAAYLSRDKQVEAVPPLPSTSAATTKAPTAGFSLDLEEMSDEDEDGMLEAIGTEAERAKVVADREYLSYIGDQTGNKLSTSGSELLLYWKGRATTTPYLAAVARKVHAVPASSAKAERTFSEAGQVVEKRRTRLHPRKVDDLLLAKDNEDLLNK